MPMDGLQKSPTDRDKAEKFQDLKIACYLAYGLALQWHGNKITQSFFG